jgi:hypothetical protein
VSDRVNMIHSDFAMQATIHTAKYSEGCIPGCALAAKNLSTRIQNLHTSKKIAFKPLNSKTLWGIQTVWMVHGRGRAHLIVLCTSELRSTLLCAPRAPNLRRGVGPVLLLGTGGPTRVGLEFKTNPPHFVEFKKIVVISFEVSRNDFLLPKRTQE